MSCIKRIEPSKGKENGEWNKRKERRIDFTLGNVNSGRAKEENKNMEEKSPLPGINFVIGFEKFR